MKQKTKFWVSWIVLLAVFLLLIFVVVFTAFTRPEADRRIGIDIGEKAKEKNIPIVQKEQFEYKIKQKMASFTVQNADEFFEKAEEQDIPIKSINYTYKLSDDKTTANILYRVFNEIDNETKYIKYEPIFRIGSPWTVKEINETYLVFEKDSQLANEQAYVCSAIVFLICALAGFVFSKWYYFRP